MISCNQTKTQNVLEHGHSVHKWFCDLYNHLTNQTQLEFTWKLPEWIYDPKITTRLLDFEILKLYQIYHDCGKPLCRTEDDQGTHFPNHAQISSQQWLDCSDQSPEAIQIARLIAMDMDIHTHKGCDVEELASRPEAVSLLITALCEVHSNAQMFGGVESTSFKIKWKQINKIGKRILDTLN
jgi:hypothetical protein